MVDMWNSLVCLSIQKKATEKYFPVVLFNILYKVFLTFESVDEIPSMTIQMQSTELSTFLWYWYCIRWVNEILKCDHLYESYWAVASSGAVLSCCKRQTDRPTKPD